MIVVMQPTYLPWMGYFDLMDQADTFVFLDNVEFSRQSWQQRNRVRTSTDLLWLTVPVLRKGRSHQLLSEVPINATENFPQSHLRTIEMSYSRAPFFKDYFEPLAQAITNGFETGSLSKMNIAVIQWIAACLKLKTKLLTSTELGAKGVRSDLVVDICKRCEDSCYLSPPGALDYLKEDHPIFERGGIEVLIQQYEHPEYKQVYSPFIPFAATIDLLFNVGPESLNVIRKGRRPATPLKDNL